MLTKELRKELAWALYCKETAGDADVRDFWEALSPRVQGIYLDKAVQLFNVAEVKGLTFQGRSIFLGGTGDARMDSYYAEHYKSYLLVTKTGANRLSRDQMCYPQSLEELRHLAWEFYCKDYNNVGYKADDWSGLSKEQQIIYMEYAKLHKHVKLCRSNLKNKRVKCCATCPFEVIIAERYPSLIPLFEQKRQLLG